MLKEFLRGRVVLVDLLAVLFGISSWISINGLWVELPLLVQNLPEGWALPSYLSMIVQLANVGPILYGVLRSCLVRPPSQPLTISLLLLVGVGSSLALALAWSHTAILGGKQHSLGLFVCVFLLSLVDCTSSVLFLPYMGLFRQMYLNSYLIGEGMSGFVPSLAALIQGVSGNPECVKVTLENGTEVEQAVTGDPRFSTSGFFSFLMVMMSMSLAAFLLLEHLSLARKEKLSESSSTTNFSAAVTGGEEDNLSLEKGEGVVRGRYNLTVLLAVQCFVCFLSNGALPSIQSYSCLPYGNTVYHLAVTLNAMANPLMAFLAFFLPCSRQKVVVCLSLVGGLLAGFILATALASPHMLGGSLGLGGTLVVGAWVVSGAIFSYVKVSVAGMCREVGRLFPCGVVTQAGSAMGSLIMFILVNQVELFSGYYVACPS